MRASAQHLTYAYPAWSGCTLNEMMLIALGSSAVAMPVLFILGLLVHHLMLCLVPFIPLTVLMSKILLKYLAQTKETKPEGFFVIQCRLRLARFGLPSPYLTRTGRWSTQVKL